MKDIAKQMYVFASAAKSMNFLVFGKADKWKVDSKTKIPLEHSLTKSPGVCLEAVVCCVFFFLFPSV